MSAGRAVNKAWKRETVSCCPFAPLWLWGSRVPSSKTASTTWVQGWGLHCNGARALPEVGCPRRSSGAPGGSPRYYWGQWLGGHRGVPSLWSPRVRGTTAAQRIRLHALLGLKPANQPGGRRDLLYRMGSQLGQIPNPRAPRLLRGPEVQELRSRPCPFSSERLRSPLNPSCCPRSSHAVHLCQFSLTRRSNEGPGTQLAGAAVGRS